MRNDVPYVRFHAQAAAREAPRTVEFEVLHDSRESALLLRVAEAIARGYNPATRRMEITDQQAQNAPEFAALRELERYVRSKKP